LYIYFHNDSYVFLKKHFRERFEPIFMGHRKIDLANLTGKSDEIMKEFSAKNAIYRCSVCNNETYCGSAILQGGTFHNSSPI